VWPTPWSNPGAGFLVSAVTMGPWDAPDYPHQPELVVKLDMTAPVVSWPTRRPSGYFGLKLYDETVSLDQTAGSHVAVYADYE